MNAMIRGVWIVVATAVAGCARGDAAGGAPLRAGVPWSPDPAATTATLPATWQRLGVGRPADSARVAAWDFDVDSSGHGLPAGRGTVTEGGAVYAAKCAMCHGPKGEGIPPAFPRLVGRELASEFAFHRDAAVVRTIGNYWPHATTLYDYIQRAMPYTAPGTLTANETYALTAWLLAENGLLAADATLDAASLMQVKMPGAGRFVDDDRGRTGR